MSVDEAAAALRNVGGIRRVEVVRKRGKPPHLKIDYDAGSISILGASNTVNLTFVDDRLTEVSLTSKECGSTVVAKLPAYREMLRNKYGNEDSKREVTADGQLVAYRNTYSDKTTHVMLRIIEESAATTSPAAPGSGAAGMIAVVLGAINSKAAEAACPEYQGALAVVEITYQSEAALQLKDQQRKREEEETKRAAQKRL